MENIKADKKLVKNWWKYRDEWISKGKSDKFLRLLSSARFYEDWEVDEPEEIIWKKIWWRDFIRKMKTFYKPTENLTVRHFQFMSIKQNMNESFSAFC